MELTSVFNTSRRFCQSSAGREDSLRMKMSIGVSSTWPRGAMPCRLIVENCVGGYIAKDFMSWFMFKCERAKKCGAFPS